MSYHSRQTIYYDIPEGEKLTQPIVARHISPYNSLLTLPLSLSLSLSFPLLFR